MTHPDAWAFLNRLVKSAEAGRATVSPEVIEEWRAGGAVRCKLLGAFVNKVYVPGGDYNTNTLRLDAFIKIRQASRDWRTSLRGYEWLTEEELATDKKWSENRGMKSEYLPKRLNGGLSGGLLLWAPNKGRTFRIYRFICIGWPTCIILFEVVCISQKKTCIDLFLLG